MTAKTLFINLWVRLDGEPAEPSIHTDASAAMDEIAAGWSGSEYDGTVIVEGSAAVAKVEDWSDQAQAAADEARRDWLDSRRLQTLTHAERGL